MYTLYAQTAEDKSLFLLCRYHEGWAKWHAEKRLEALQKHNPKGFKGLHLLGPDNKMVWSFALDSLEERSSSSASSALHCKKEASNV